MWSNQSDYLKYVWKKIELGELKSLLMMSIEFGLSKVRFKVKGIDSISLLYYTK